MKGRDSPSSQSDEGIAHTYPEEEWSDHTCMQSPGWQPMLCVAWCLIWWFASLEKYGHTWHQMSILRPGVNKQPKPSLIILIFIQAFIEWSMEHNVLFQKKWGHYATGMHMFTVQISLKVQWHVEFTGTFFSGLISSGENWRFLQLELTSKTAFCIRPGTCHCYVSRGSMESQVWPTRPYMTSRWTHFSNVVFFGNAFQIIL